MKVVNELGSDVEYIVCVLADVVTPWHDNKLGPCALCARTVQHRPHVPAGIPLICMDCYHRIHTPGDTVVVAKRVVLETLNLLRNN